MMPQHHATELLIFIILLFLGKCSITLLLLGKTHIMKEHI